LKHQKPRFFCDNCGEEVDNDVKACPYCGRFFASVRCPACGFSGEDKLFEDGCPACGYSADGKSKKKKKPPKKVKKPKPQEEPLPAGVYIVTLLVLFVVVAVLSFLITR
jgi:uncharacterized membrane protein YvbJ